MIEALQDRYLKHVIQFECVQNLRKFLFLLLHTQFCLISESSISKLKKTIQESVLTELTAWLITTKANTVKIGKAAMETTDRKQQSGIKTPFSGSIVF